MRQVKAARVPASEAATAIPRLMAGGLVDRTARISREGGCRLVPLAEGAEEAVADLGYGVVVCDAHTLDRRPPFERILAALRGLPAPVLSVLPHKWEHVGDILILRLDPLCLPHRGEIGRAYAEVLGARTVCIDTCGVVGDLRRPSMEVIHGARTESVRLENGILYGFDVTEVMFASGNNAERRRMAELDCRGETVVDMFAGIGYFTLPLARFAGPDRVFACEKNPDSYRFLLENIGRNGVGDTVIPILADNRDLSGRRFADRILMGYLQRTAAFLPKALSMIRDGGIIHYHDTLPVRTHAEDIGELFSASCGPDGYEVESLREVKSFAPSVSHYVADVRIRHTDSPEPQAVSSVFIASR
jgi:tRNA wybutosine-synthesizing protein 2